MLKKLTFALILSALVGCSAQLKERSFIVQDKEVTPYQAEDIAKWQQGFANHKLRRIKVKAEDGKAVLYGLHLDTPDSKEVVFFIPGNGMKVTAGGIQALQSFGHIDRDFVIFDRRGLGASNGQAIIANLVSDSIAQVGYIKKQLQAEKVIVHGFSLGSFVAAQLAKQANVDALVLQGSATNVNEWIDARTPWYMKPFLTIDIEAAFHTVDNKAVVANDYTGPLLIIAAEKDQQAPVQLSEVLYKVSHSANKQLVIVEGADHNNMFDSQETINAYLKFLASLDS